MPNGYPPQGGEGEGQPPPPPPGRPPYREPGPPPGRPPYPQQQPPGGYHPYPQQQQPGGYQPYPQAGNQYRTGPSGPRANFGQRLVAWIIDVIITAIPVWIIGALLGATFFSFEIDERTGEMTTANGATAGSLLLYNLISIALPLAYYAYFEGGSSGQTIGKRAMSIRVLRMSGTQLGWGLAIGRYFARILSFLPCLLGYFWMLWDRERQTWHDKLTNTVVVPTAAYPVQPPGGYQGQGAPQYRP